MRVEVSIRGRDFGIDDGVLDRYGDADRPAAVASEPARLVYAAAHVVLSSDYAEAAHTLADPGDPAEIAAAIDDDATARLRMFLDDHGFGVAEAMDTAQRFRIGWPAARRLIEACGRLGLRNGFIAGAGVDHLDDVRDEADLVSGVVHQIEVVQNAGGQPIVLPMPWLSRGGAAAADYVQVYGDIIRAAGGPLWIHWLGEAFHPALAGYFPGDSFSRVMALDPAKVRGAKLSLLDADREVHLRRELLSNDQLLLTGDDYHFARLIRGGDAGSNASVAPPVERHTDIAGRRVQLGDFSHALLGIFDAIAVPASRALGFLAAGDVERYTEIMTPCEALSRWLFQPPTDHYKAGLAFLAWLDGRQENCFLVDHEERARDLDHYLRAADLAARAGVFRDATVTAERLRSLAAGR